MRPKSIKELRTFLGISSLSEAIIHDFAIDSRRVKKGDLFFALKGEKVDGHKFLKMVKAKGGVAAVIHHSYQGPDFGLILLKTNDVLETLQVFAKTVLINRKTKVIAITGSLGKTTTKDFIYTLLKEKYRVAKTPGNYNSQITLPLSILKSAGDEDFLILELGISKPNEMAKLMEVVTPYIAVMTRLAHVHIANFLDFRHLANEKGLIFSNNNTITGFINRDAPFFEEMLAIGSCSKISYSVANSTGPYYLKSISEHEIEIYRYNCLKLKKKISIPGLHNHQNLLAAIAVAIELKLAFSEIDRGIDMLELPESRMQFIRKKGAVFILDAYNANADSMIAALNSMPDPKLKGRKIAILSDMVEQGKYLEDNHSLVALHALTCVDHLFLIGEGCKVMKDIWVQAGRKVDFFDAFNDLKKRIKQVILPEDVILIKGSRLKALERLLEVF